MSDEKEINLRGAIRDLRNVANTLDTAKFKDVLIQTVDRIGFALVSRRRLGNFL